ncbi:MAG: DUF3575 domain-containing protein [Bacteroidales bacterium]|nr:DUF3575 domain-containing protein [Bacteroidales bacterium]
MNSAKLALRAFLAAFMLFAATPFGAIAQERVVKDGSEGYAYDFQIFFPVNISKFSENYLDNPESLAKLDSIIAIYGANVIDSLLIVARSSPEGRYQFNMDLALNRAKSMSDYLTTHYPDLNAKIRLDHGISPWPKSKSKKDLVRLRYAAFRLVFPFDIEIPVPQMENVVIDESLYALDLPEEVIEQEPIDVVIPAAKSKMTILALKTNLLYDAVTALNFEIEVPIGKRWSIMWEDVFPWWETGNKYCLQHWEMGPEVRYWFKPWDVYGTDKLRGFFAGVYGMSSRYDFQYDRSLNWQGEYWSTGLSGGWSTALGRSKWGNLELSLALGYLSTRYRGYIPADDYSLLIRNPYRVGSASYWGPTKAKVSLVIPINVTIMKKGDTK